ncbi:hypothetical protein A2380_00830 [candidate division WWE3 bacterium RIFOXYB1_FULL_43_24]|uniref:Uncharacterized protein n=1 Tax=candidate division WWE3 bacterium GW2011_GWF1_42_14 TaxID=1619138 RepID=A0A0G0YRH3_UNCKA|nr:MAG: hypothetical protein UU92_C0005G0089 [candidate division WWE3 bacterium GW2011_GWA1_42_12]KKS34083.1 MAG: hypothetical protein UU97_C0015G0016 [candidate division WWE3 bacterium GW2011_GWD1_42_14]KKS39257.1 MAG: hypothetical protein UV00_C0003G0089 [candidate division WWE3 bacterium GW2011_GWF1_42_14]KKS40755.1 MAG: hypothetical protein UV03_C0003G0068 [candidate division WWE3 bacterium GW2011_GWE1_42_16]OGC60117.1 MAG: hypothetical protein A2212_00425 [candidate division WWE3 bacterium
MRVTRTLEKQDALLIAVGLNEKFPRLHIVRENWPVVILENWGNVEYEKYRVCYLEISFKVTDVGPHTLCSTIKGHVEIGQEDFTFEGFNPSVFSKEPDIQKLLRHLGLLAKDVLARKQECLLKELDAVNKDLALFSGVI